MKPISTPLKYIALVFLLLGPFIAFYLISKGDHQFVTLPYYGPKELDYNEDGSVDTIYHKVPDFEFVNQFGETVTEADFEDNILIVDFFFTTCPTICPKMTNHMAGLQLELNDKHFDDVRFLSHTVNPEHDTPKVLLMYGEKHDADFDRWTFLTGEKEEIYEQGVKGYMLPAQEDALAPGGFLHSEQFVLVDKNQNIRGYYDGTEPEEVRNLIKDLKMLIKETNENAHQAQN